MANTNYDVIVIGGGPGGYVAAIRAAQLGLKAVVVEREHLGGICLNWGCIPTKALLRSAEVLHQIKDAKSYGLQVEGVSFDIKKIVRRSRQVSRRLTHGIGHLLGKNKVDVIEGVAKLGGKGKVSVTLNEADDGKKTTELTGKHIILATGARARELPGLEIDGKLLWSYKEAMVPEAMPKSLLVIGSGAIGVEFASFYNDLGAEVTVIEMVDRILPVEDEEISAQAAKSFAGAGIKIHTKTTVKSLKKGKDNLTAVIDIAGKQEELVVDRVIVAAGIVGNAEGLGLEGTKVKIEKTHIVTNEWGETGEPGVYAIGDVAGPPWLAHKASHEGVVCVEKIAGVEGVHPMDASSIPGCTYSRPQIASVGMTEAQAKVAGRKVKVGRFPFAGNGKAVALGEPDGLVKTIFDAGTGEFLGAHMIGAEVTELIQGYVIAKSLETTEAELMHTVFPHPTLSEMMHESVLDAYGRAIHF